MFISIEKNTQTCGQQCSGMLPGYWSELEENFLDGTEQL